VPSNPRNLRAALRCATRGWPVFPVHSIRDGSCTCGKKCGKNAAKHPRTANGFEDATCDADTITRWWSRWPDANIGVGTGDVSGIVVLDVDPEKGGNESLERLLQGRRLPKTPTVHTGGDGLHIYFALPPGVSYASRNALLPGLDAKAKGGYAIAPPSNHRSGNRYLWRRDQTPEKVKLSVVPDWLSSVLSKPKRKEVLGSAGESEPIPEGQRHDSLVRMAGALRRQGATPADIEAVLLAVNDRRCAPPLPAEEVSRIAESAEDWEPGSSCRYAQRPSGLFLIKPTRDGIQEVKLANFQARIVGDLIEDDGIEKKRSYAIEAVSADGRRRRFVVSAQQFEAMRWPAEHLGPTAVVSAGLGLRDHARVAIQELSGSDIERQIVFAHSGWRKYQGEWAYLHCGGAIGAEGLINTIRVQLPGSLEQLRLLSPPTGRALVTAVRASMKVLELAPPRVTFPLYGAIWSSVMGSCDYSMFCVGPTGVGKTELAAQAQQHFGAGFNARNLPGTWLSTGNANEGLAFAAKDALFTVDDFAPTGTRSDLARYNREADRLLRAQGNASGRGRMRPDGTLRPPKKPRGLIIATGEDCPRGQSLRGRIFVLEVSPDDLDWELLTKCQQTADAGLYAQAMSAFLQWLAPRYEARRKKLPAALAEWRAEATNSRWHRRVPEIIAQLQLGFCRFLQFAKAVKALSEDEAFELQEKSWRALGEAAATQGSYQRAEDPVRRFLELVRSALSTGRAYLAYVENLNSRRGEGDCIGWISEDLVLLDPDVAFATAQKLAQEQGEFLTVGQKTLWQRMRDRGLLARTDADRNLVRFTIGKQRRRVLALTPRTLGFSSEDRDNRDT
jgi:hypothetical protein